MSRNKIEGLSIDNHFSGLSLEYNAYHQYVDWHNLRGEIIYF